MKIMAVDDEHDILRLLTRILGGAGYEVVTCSSGEECLQRFPAEKPDLILLDIMMPGMDGWSTYKRIKEIDKGQKVAFLTVLGVPGPPREAMIEMGAADYIMKPFTPEELLKRIKTLLEK
jgi:DNA-binding response OmpR family regulator